MKFLRRLSINPILVVITLTVCGALFATEILPWHMGDFSPSPTTAFREILNRPLPRGISRLVIVSRQFAIKRWIWMRFQVTDQAIASLIHSTDRITDPSEITLAMGGKRGVVNHRFDSKDLTAVGWQQVQHIQKPEIYKVSSYSDGFSYLIIDQKRHLVFVHGSGD